MTDIALQTERTALANMQTVALGYKAERDALQAAYDQLTGEKFSDRVHVVLRSRAQKAEAERDALRAALERAYGKLIDISVQSVTTAFIRLSMQLAKEIRATLDGATPQPGPQLPSEYSPDRPGGEE